MVLSGVQQIYGTATSTTVASGGQQVVNTGAVESGAIILAGGTQFDSSTAFGDIVSGGTQLVFGSASGTLVSGAGGIEAVQVGGAVTGNTVVAGGAEFVSGAATSTTVGSGGFQFVQGSGHANSTTVSGPGAFQVVNSGGFASNAIVESGGTINISAGGVMSNTVVSSGGTEVVSSGGTLSGATLSGGQLEIVSGGTAGSSTINISAGTLILDDSQNFSGSIAGLLTSGVQNVDLADINFATLQTLGYSDSGTSGTLTVTDGTHTALLNMIGAYTVGSFKTSDDGHGGVLLTDPPVSSGVTLGTGH